MEVRALTLHIADADLNSLVAKWLPSSSPLEDVSVQIRPEGICVKGVYPLLVNVSFESWWVLGVVIGKVSANLAKLKAFGMPAMVFKSAVLKSLQELSAREYWFEVQGDEVHLDMEYLLGRHVGPARIHLRSLLCREGLLVVEAGKRMTSAERSSWREKKKKGRAPGRIVAYAFAGD